MTAYRFLILTTALAMVSACGGGDKKSANKGGDGDGGEVVDIGRAEVVGKGKRPPRVSGLTLSIDQPTVTDDIGVELEVVGEYDIDYRWLINGAEDMRNAGRDTLRAGSVRRGDRVQVVAVVSDGDGNSTEVKSPAITVVNSFPEITSYPIGDPNGFTFEASDADDDRISWTLESAPPGWRLDRNGRLTTGDPRPGSWDLKVVADDGAGGTAYFESKIDIAEPETEQRDQEPDPEPRKPMEDMNDEELDKHAEEWEKRIESMTDEELEAYQKKLEEQGN